jgi:hypothetical protein
MDAEKDVTGLSESGRMKVPVKSMDIVEPLCVNRTKWAPFLRGRAG